MTLTPIAVTPNGTLSVSIYPTETARHFASVPRRDPGVAVLPNQLLAVRMRLASNVFVKSIHFAVLSPGMGFVLPRLRSRAVIFVSAPTMGVVAPSAMGNVRTRPVQIVFVR